MKIENKIEKFLKEAKELKIGSIVYLQGKKGKWKIIGIEREGKDSWYNVKNIETGYETSVNVMSTPYEIIKEANEEESQTGLRFERFLEILKKFGGEEEIKVGIKDGSDGKIQRILFDRAEFDRLNKKATGDKNIVNVANNNGMYVFANDKYVVMTEFKEYMQQPYKLKNLVVLGKKDL